MSLILGLLRKNYCQWFRNYQLRGASSNCLYTRFLRYIIHVEQEFYANLPGCIPKKRNCAFLKQSDSKIYLEDSPENLQTQYMATRSSLKDVLVSWDERGHVLFEIVLERCFLFQKSFKLGLSPLPVRVTTRIITFLVGNPYKPSFPLLLGGGQPKFKLTQLFHFHRCFEPMLEQWTSFDASSFVLVWSASAQVFSGRRKMLWNVYGHHLTQPVAKL